MNKRPQRWPRALTLAFLLAALAGTAATAAAALAAASTSAQPPPQDAHGIGSIGQAASPRPAPEPKPSTNDVATLAAAVEANRIANAALEAQMEAALWQARLGIGALTMSGVAGLAAIAAALYARNAWRENQRSADVAERMLSGYERPFLLLEIVKSGVTLRDKSITFDVTKYQFRNLGRVPALITRRHFELVSAGAMPEAIDPNTEAGKTVVHGIAVGADGVSQEYETGRALPLQSVFKKVHLPPRPLGNNDRTVYFHGFVEYRDLSGRSWITGFCFAQSDNEIGFQPLSFAERGGPDPYNYDRQIT
jgi:hypothetical protein